MIASFKAKQNATEKTHYFWLLISEINHMPFLNILTNFKTYRRPTSPMSMIPQTSFRKLRNVKIKSDSILITLDVESMNTNIDNERGLEVVKMYFTDSEPMWLELSLKYNDFAFNRDTFAQISGTAMGKKFAPHIPTFSWQKGKPQLLTNAV